MRQQMASNDNGPKVIKLGKTPKSKSTVFQEKWGHDVARFRFTMVPSLLLKAQSRLGLKPTHLAVIIQILEHWWEADRKAWPSKDLLAAKLGIHPRNVQRAVAELEKRGYIERKQRYWPSGGKATNEYDFDGLVSALKKIAPDFQKAEEEAKAKKEAVVRRGYRVRASGAPK
jgi:predicted transcriptional regulator